MADEIIEELWAVKDALAKEANYNIDQLIKLMQDRRKQRDHEKDISPSRTKRVS